MGGRCPLKVVFLSAGYGTRLQNDLKNEPSGEYSHLIGLPKALVPLGSYDALLTHWWRLLQKYETQLNSWSDFKLGNVYIITNETHYSQFQEWANRHGFPRENLLNNHTNTNETRLGAIQDLQLSIHSYGSLENTLVIGADILLLREFDLEHFLQRFCHLNSSLTTHYVVEDTRKNGILELDDSGRIVHFLEKPAPTETKSRFACPCFYLFKKEDLKYIEEFLLEMKQQHTSKEAIDAPGHLIKWLHHKTPIHSMPITGRLDIGGLASYIEAEEYCRMHY
ncbi:nucleotide-diphospho-sugar transferase [Basidiobolus meristosporus CBS 931.73]|uniref:Nucleotide-diphospho-sugar transferase n=1 Tax=Basidiobolus meristosporus CBS 931.73 TaxID=1314790 RepID=A0A1Y1XWS4_9FUNG|nr:nucleotide-diphospho-sugar transferase [Basidiobolus meristosporus CBS 931.73]|eukprot:ORX90211.1 nucleotide-diphospho-sugar transferase [Basidiobolus meristosporus CBS 931.73]